MIKHEMQFTEGAPERAGRFLLLLRKDHKVFIETHSYCPTFTSWAFINGIEVLGFSDYVVSNVKSINDAKPHEWDRAHNAAQNNCQ